MRLKQAQVKNYRSIKDTGIFNIEKNKTILVGPNEAGKTVILQALQQLNPPKGVKGFDDLRDYPRSKYNDITIGKVTPVRVTVVTGYFELEDSEKELIPDEFRNCTYVLGRRLDNRAWHRLEGGPSLPTYGKIKRDLKRLQTHVDSQFKKVEEEGDKPSESLAKVVVNWQDSTEISDNNAKQLKKWLDEIFNYVEEGNEKEEKRHESLTEQVKLSERQDEVLTILDKAVPVFILFNNYFRVKPSIHLEHLVYRVENNTLDDEYYDYGNLCLLKLLGFTPQQLSDLGNTESPRRDDPEALKNYRDNLDRRSYQLNAASVKLTNEIRSVWLPNPNRPEADKLKILADGQYLKVVVEDDLGVDIELDQRSEGFQWLVSFFVVFFAEAMDKHKNAILLLDEPGMSLHGLKQRDFRLTISRLAENNQTIYSTHSPFLVGPDELDLVRVIEMIDREIGTKVHTTLSSSDPAGLLPLQEAFGYDLAQSLFTQQRNLVLEGITDYWYFEATAQLLREAKIIDLNNKIALVFANNAGKVVYYATILHAHSLKVAALLDSDTAGDTAAQQETLVHTLGNKNILRTKDSYSGSVTKSEIEDLLRDTLVHVGKIELGWDIVGKAASQPSRPIADIFADEINDFSKYKLAKAYLRWTRNHEAKDLQPHEVEQWRSLFDKVNKVLK